MTAKWKYREVDALKDKVAKSKVICLVDVTGIPSNQFQIMRKKLGNEIRINVGRNRLISRAFDASGRENIDDLKKHINGTIGVLCSDTNPFKLWKVLEGSKIAAPLRAGSKAPRDIIVPAGPTPFSPGPVIAELQSAKIKAQIKGPKIVVTEDSLVLKEGDDVKPEIASLLTRLGIKPGEMGLSLVAAYEDGIVFSEDVLAIDDEVTKAKVAGAHVMAMNLALNARIFNSSTIIPLIQDAFSKAKNLAVNAQVVNSETIPYILSKARLQMLAVASLAPDALDDQLKDALKGAAPTASVSEKKEEKKEEKELEKKEEIEEVSEEEAASGLASLFG